MIVKDDVDGLVDSKLLKIRLSVMNLVSDDRKMKLLNSFENRVRMELKRDVEYNEKL